MVFGNPFIGRFPIEKLVEELVVGEVERITGKTLTTRHKKWSFKDNPAPGTHIRVRRMLFSGSVVPRIPGCKLVSDKYGINLYEHHGIYIGDGKVIHFAAADGDFSTDIKIRKTTLKNFLDGGKLEIRDFDAVDNVLRFSADEVVKRAEAELKGQNFGSYNVLTNNCEHFANYCVFGKRFSEQVGDKEPGLKDKWSFENDPAPGTHIRVRRMFVPGIVVPGHFLKMPVRTLVSDKYGINLYEHHGVCIGDGKVIHFAAADGDFSIDIKIRKTTLKNFLDGGKLEIRDFDAVDNVLRFSADEVVKRAEAELKNQNFGSYNLLTNNCEHFANYCVFGERFSEQVGDKEPGLDYIDDENLPDIVIY